MEYVDRVLISGNSGEKSSLKQMFGLGIVRQDADFARWDHILHLDTVTNTHSAISLPLELWQSGEPNFQPFCDAIEVSLYSNIVEALC